MGTKIKPEIIGDIGEYIAENYLVSQGFDLVQFGKSKSRKENTIHKKSNLPILPDFGIGYSFGDFRIFSNLDFDLSWRDPKIPKWADFPYESIKELATRCRKYMKCTMRDKSNNSAPCANINRILDKNWLSRIYPYNPDYNFYTDDMKPIKLKGYNLITCCLKNFSNIILSDYRNSLPSKDNFLLANMQILDYIQRCWWKHSEQNPLPHDYAKIISIEKTEGIKAAENLKNENRIALKKFPNSHPGRYDFIGFKKNKYYAIEVKVNSSQLSYWQTVRLGLLKKFGHEIMIVRIKMSQKQINDAATGEEPKFNKIILDNNINSLKVPIPKNEDFLSTIQFVARHERLKNSKNYRIPKVKFKQRESYSASILINFIHKIIRATKNSLIEKSK